MKTIDIVKMAVHNMLRRPYRTALNLLGIILGTSIILMTLAGSDGVKHALNSLFENSEETRKVIVRRAPKLDESMLDESKWQVKAEMSEERRARIELGLKNYLIQELQMTEGRFFRINTEVIEEFRTIDHTLDVVPQVWLRFRLEQDDFATTTLAEGVSPNAVGMNERMVAGGMLGPEDVDSVLIHEVLAYQMGYATQTELEQLIGQEVVLKFKANGRGNQLASILEMGADNAGVENLAGQVELLKALGTLVEDIDLSNLTPQQKKLIESKFRPAIEKDVESSLVEKRVVIKGVYHDLGDDMFSILRQFTFDSSNPVLFHFETATDLQANVLARNDFYSATVYVDSYKNVGQVEKDLKKMGYNTVSIMSVLAGVEERVNEIGRLIYVIAFVILLMTVFAITNALIMSVMERTAEFGIMKSLGAKNSNIVGLMLIEGALLGAIGAAIAIVASIVLAKLGQGWLRGYVESRMNQTIAEDVFSFSPTSIGLAFVGAVLICCLASIIPAWRAARLDPIVAMHRK